MWQLPLTALAHSLATHSLAPSLAHARGAPQNEVHGWYLHAVFTHEAALKSLKAAEVMRDTVNGTFRPYRYKRNLGGGGGRGCASVSGQGAETCARGSPGVCCPARLTSRPRSELLVLPAVPLAGVA